MKALILLLLSGTLSAGVFITGKQIGHQAFSPLVILFWQLTGGALLIWALAWSKHKFPVWNAEHVRYYLFGGLLGVTLPYIFAYVVLRELQVGIVGLLTALSPVLTYAMARFLGHEPGHPVRLIGLMTGLTGVALLVSPGSIQNTGSDQAYIALALAIPITLAASNIYRSRYWPQGSGAMPLVAGMLTVQAVWLFFVNLFLGQLDQIVLRSVDFAGLFAALALFAGSSYLSTFKLLRLGGPVYLSQMGYVITAVTLLVGIVLFDEQYAAGDIYSMALILTGVFLTTWAGRSQRLKTA